MCGLGINSEVREGAQRTKGKKSEKVAKELSWRDEPVRRDPLEEGTDSDAESKT